MKAGTGLAEHDIEVPKEGSMVGKVINAARRTIGLLIGGIVVALAILFVAIFAYVLIPTLTG